MVDLSMACVLSVVSQLLSPPLAPDVEETWSEVVRFAGLQLPTMSVLVEPGCDHVHHKTCHSNTQSGDKVPEKATLTVREITGNPVIREDNY